MDIETATPVASPVAIVVDSIPGEEENNLHDRYYYIMFVIYTIVISVLAITIYLLIRYFV
jgi:heme/copper-type cytochrome/quinol oxidase subunit 2